MECPRCGFGGVETAACPRCGVVFSKLRSRPRQVRPGPATAAGSPVVPDGRMAWISRAARRALAIGGAAAVATHLVPFLRFVFTYLIILIHEFGHAVVGWTFGYPSIPAFDFTFGGGLTFHENRAWTLVALVVVALGYAVYRLRDRPRLAGLVAGGGAAYVLLAATSAHEFLQIAAGHGAELAIAGLFLYRAVGGSELRSEAERPAYAFAASFILLGDLRFAWGLMTSAAERAAYAAAKGGGDWMDFSRLANEYLGVELERVAAAFLFLTLLVPLAALWAHASRDRIEERFRRLAGRSAEPGPAAADRSPAQG